MTTEQAIIELIFLNSGLHKDFNSSKAIKTAIRSLGAWKMILDKLNEMREPTTDAFGETSTLVTINIEKLMEIIEECLSQIEE